MTGNTFKSKSMKLLYRIQALVLAASSVLLSLGCNEQDIECAPTDANIPVETDGGYLWAFMTNNKYGKLFYALSRDGFNWQTLNRNHIIDPAYIGHPDICQGRDGAYYMLAVQPFALWRSEDMVTWEKNELDEDILNRSNDMGLYVTYYLGAPKMFFDKDSDQYIITWHACQNPDYDDWTTMATLYVLTKDFQTFSEPKKLFAFTGEAEGMPTIDVIIRKINGRYYALYKDERSPELAPLTGKTIRMSVSDNLTGPYSNPSAPLTPNDNNREAPILVERPAGAGWALYAEICEGSPLGYSLFISPTIDGVWSERTFNGPNVKDGTSRPGARHGCIVKIPEATYQAIEKAYGNK